MTQDVCAVGASAGIQTFGLGVSGGKHFIDKNCERLKLARILNDFGMKVAAVAILCQDERVFESMIQAGTPCPIDGKIGKQAFYKQLGMSLNEAYKYTSKVMCENMMTLDAREGISAFLEKRTPNWKNK